MDKQIEGMMRLMCADFGEGCKDCPFRIYPPCQAEAHAEALFEAGYCKQSEGEWISVNDRLPDRAGKYLVSTFDGRVGISNLIDYYCDGDLSFDNYKVTHWMPLPKPPKMKGE